MAIMQNFEEDKKIPKFERIGGSLQPNITKGEDLAKLLELDPAHWAVTSIDTTKYSCDPEFLEFLDTDRNGKIRVDEIKNILRWVLPRMKNFQGFEKGSTELVFADLDQNTPEGLAIYNSAKFAMQNAGMPEADRITLADIRDHQKLLAYGLSNGDGVVPPEQICVEELSIFANQVMTLGGKVKDISGADGIDAGIVAAFAGNATKFLAWKKAPSENPAIFARGADTPALYGKFISVKEKVDEYFKLCQVIALADGNSTLTASALDPMNIASMENFMKNAPIAKAVAAEELDLNGNLNPAWKGALEGFFNAFVPEKSVITIADWKEITAILTPYGSWINSKPCAIFDAMDDAALAKLQQDLDNGMTGKLEELIALDKSSGENVLCFSQVRKLILLQQNLMEFLNNYVSLKALFTSDRQAMLQHGELIMDGRHFSLVTPLTNIAEHKKLAGKCYICVMYIETVSGVGAAMKKLNYAVAVTSGDMNNLFVGKYGIFITGNGTVCDAKVVDYIQQPVSFSEALKMPFFKFGEMVGKQIDKFFSARSKEVESGVTKSFTDAQKYTPADPKGAPKPPAQTPAVSGSMMLMGGGLGIAAIGSSFAFMAQAMKNVSVWNVLLVFLCVILIFSGPLVIMSLIKLYRRSISSFLEAGGVAINKRMRLTRKMGAIFTRNPHIPLKNFINSQDVVNGAFDKLIPGQAGKSLFRKVVFILIFLLILCGIATFIFYKVCPEKFGKLFCGKECRKECVKSVKKPSCPAEKEACKKDTAQKTAVKTPAKASAKAAVKAPAKAAVKAAAKTAEVKKATEKKTK